MERAACAYRTLYPDHPPVQLDDALAVGQAYPKAVHLTSGPGVDTVKRVKDPRQVLGRDSKTLVVDADLGPLLLVWPSR